MSNPVDTEAAFSAMRWQHIRTVEAMQTLLEKNVDLEREIFDQATAFRTERMILQSKIKKINERVTLLARLLRGEIENVKGTVYRQFAGGWNDAQQSVKKLSIKCTYLNNENEELRLNKVENEELVARLRNELLKLQNQISSDAEGKQSVLSYEVASAY
jgi:hypothetical protein